MTSSPATTGGAGTDFEFRVGGSCLTLLLTQGAPLFLGAGTLNAVHFQTSHLGWATEDLLLEAVDEIGTRKKAAIQVKSSFVLNASDPDCVSTLQRALTDFRNAKLFDPRNDVVGLVTGSLSAKLARALRTLLDCARASIDARDMGERLKIPGYLGKPAGVYYDTIVAILNGIDGQKPTEEDIWRFLCRFNVLDVDLNVEGGATETMMRTLLRLTSSDRSPTDADSTWNELCVLAAKKTGTAASYTLEILPATLRQRHGQTTGYPTAIGRLLEDTQIVTQGIRTTIGENTEIPRREIFGKLCQSLEDNPLVFVRGEAGSGKSVLSKRAFSLIAGSTIGFAFRAESLAGTHINDVLARSGLTLEELRARTAFQHRKILWIDSLERLMEKPPELRVAFLDLLRGLKCDSTWRLLVTCRDYSAETVKSALFGEVGMSAADLTVPELHNTELDETARAFPALQRPLSSPSLRRLLRKPFLLDKAARMEWPPAEPLPQHEAAFREKVWREVICGNEDLAGGLPKLRSETLIEVALRRAKAMEPFVHADGLNVRACHTLIRDSLLSQQKADLLAPAHDVIEDWAVAQWLDTAFERNGRRLQPLYPLVGTYPALRRGFRKWLTELLNAAPANTDALIVDVIRNVSIEAHWREDTLLAVLQSQEANSFLHRNFQLLVAEGARILRQAIHLIRVACRAAIPRRMFGLKEDGDIFLPIGGAWGAAAELMEEAATQFQEADFPFVLGFLEDWSWLTRWNLKNPLGAKSIANLIFHWLPIADSWKCPIRDAQERLLKLLLKIPLAGEPRLSRMVELAFEENRRGHRDSGLPNLIFSHLYGDAVCRDLPDLALQVADHELGLDLSVEETLSRHSGYEMNAMNDAFGFGFRFAMDDYPPSAYHGPFYRILFHHPERGLNLILRAANRACEAFALYHRTRGLPEPGQVSIRLPDGTTLQQFGNGRLWEWYRGFTQGPDIVKSALMALERWLLEKANRADTDLPDVLIFLLRQTNNVAITAVVASVAVAYPNVVGEAAVAVLTCPHFFRADLERSVSESMYAPRSISPGWISVEYRVCEEERVESAGLPHRQQHLENLAVALQGTRWRDRIWELIDAYKADLPAEDAQTEEDKIWRLRLHVMDVRNFIEVGKTQEGYHVFQAGPPPPDVKKVVEAKETHSTAWNSAMHLFMWGKTVFNRESRAGIDSGQWKQRLVEAQAQADLPRDPDLLPTAGPGYVAAVCIRDRWTELNAAEKEWCTRLVIESVETDADSTDQLKVGALNPMDPSRPAALIISALFDKDIPPTTRPRLLHALAKAVSHSVDEVVKFAVQGIAAYLWRSDRSLALTCVQALIMEATEQHQFWEQRRRQRFDEHKLTQEQFREKLLGRLRELIQQHKSGNETDILDLDMMDWPGRQVATHLFTILVLQPTDPLARRFFKTNVARLAARWIADQERQPSRSRSPDDERELDPRVEHLYVDSVAQFVLELPPREAQEIYDPLFPLAATRPEKVADVVRWLVVRQGDRVPATTLWALWQSFADTFLQSPALAEVDEEHSDSAKLLRELFLGENWGEMRNWGPLHGEQHRIRDLFNRLPGSRTALESYSYYLAKIGSSTLPSAILDLATKLSTLTPATLLSEATVLYLEEILTRLIYGGNRQLRAQLDLRQSCVKLLDALVAAGSSVAYKLRDDFLTPTPNI